MTQDGRLIQTDPVVMGVWRRLRSEFATWKMLVFAGFWRRTWSQYSTDQFSSMLEATHWKVSLGLLGGLSDRQVAFLREFARLNAERVERQFRATATIMVTVPVATLVAVNELAPNVLVQLGLDQAESFIFVLGTWFVVTAVMMAYAWRAKDLQHLLDFEHARRQLDPDPVADKTE